jgi:hypothetical protein
MQMPHPIPYLEFLFHCVCVLVRSQKYKQTNTKNKGRKKLFADYPLAALAARDIHRTTDSSKPSGCADISALKASRLRVISG